MDTGGNGLISYVPQAQVRFLERLEQPEPDGWQLHRTSATGREAADAVESVGSDRLILCLGADDQKLPIPGWDLAGALAAGGTARWRQSAGRRR